MGRKREEPRTCLRCGGQLPENCSSSRRYCDECGRLHNIELTRERLRKGYDRKLAEDRLKQSAKDREYCKKCRYYGSEEYGHNLCDYMLVTGIRRGCHYGVGCERRVMRELAK